MDLSYLIILISASLSTIGTLLVILTYFISKKIQRLDGIKLVIILEFINLCDCLAIYIPTPVYPDNRILCDIQGILLQVFEISEFL